jgi:hypothetical protein
MAVDHGGTARKERYSFEEIFVDLWVWKDVKCGCRCSIKIEGEWVTDGRSFL